MAESRPSPLSSHAASPLQPPPHLPCSCPSGSLPCYHQGCSGSELHSGHTCPPFLSPAALAFLPLETAGCTTPSLPACPSCSSSAAPSVIPPSWAHSCHHLHFFAPLTVLPWPCLHIPIPLRSLPLVVDLHGRESHHALIGAIANLWLPIVAGLAAWRGNPFPVPHQLLFTLSLAAFLDLCHFHQAPHLILPPPGR